MSKAKLCSKPYSKPYSKTFARRSQWAHIFSALSDETRLYIVDELSKGEALSITQLTENTKLTRQAVTKHLKVLENVRLVHSTKAGRENLFELDLKPFKDMKDYLNYVSTKWEQSLDRLKMFVEAENKK